ncbi:hypothetical protein [Kaarinaea lacus]
MIIEKNACIIVDRVLNDLPVAAWTDFEVGSRDNLHQPIKCRIRLYHANASMILERIIEAMELVLGEQLARLAEGEECSVLPFDSK